MAFCNMIVCSSLTNINVSFGVAVTSSAFTQKVGSSPLTCATVFFLIGFKSLYSIFLGHERYGLHLFNIYVYIYNTANY